MTWRPRVSALALLPLLAVAACGGGGGGGGGATESSGIPGNAQDMRASVATTYWKVNEAMPASIDLSVGRGKFMKCSKDRPSLAAYQVENMIDAKDGKVTAAQLLSRIKSALAPQGWRITLSKAQPSPTESAAMSRTTGYVADKDGLQLQLLLQERTKTVQAGGFLDLWSGCSGLGSSQKGLLAKYAPGDSVDVYQPTAATPHPVPTGDPTTAP